MLLDSVYTVLSMVYGHRPASVREGVFKVNDEIHRMFTCLFDSGALHHSYINKDIVEKHRLKWAKYIRPYEAWVRLADQKTVIKTREIVRGVLSFVSDGGTDFSGEVDAIVWDMRGLDFILGLPDIVRNFITLFFLMLKQYQLDLCAVSTQETVLESPMKPGEVMHWSEQLDQEAEEEAQCPMPTASAPMLAFLETSHEEAMKIYKDSLDAHIGPRLAKSKAFRDILESDLAVKRFVPDEWLGLNIPPLKLEVRDSLPEAHPVHSRPINPKLWDVARKEFDRLKGYNYTPSKSPWASPLVTASKATTPFIRFCGDYQWLNPHLVMPQAYIPRVQYEIEKAARFPLKADMDLTNAFHQVLMDELSRRLLAIQTPWGLYEPQFMPEGISPASGYLQTIMREIFADFEEWTVVIFDNICLLAHDEEDMCRKMKMFLERCEEYNVILKMPKSWMGFESIKFFGYKITDDKYELDVDRKKSIEEFEMPTSQKSMQRFLGAALFFKSFVANYSDVAAKLNKMVHKDFNWNKSTWKEDYVKAFEDMKKALISAIALFFPDYSLP